MNKKDYNNYKENIKKIIYNEMYLTDGEYDRLKKSIESRNVFGELPLNFYRYRVFNEYTLSEILNQDIFLSPPNQFDDVYECKYFYSPFGYHSALEKMMDPRRPSEDKNAIVDLNDEYESHLRIGCLTQDYKNIPMWYYYADMHRGYV